MAQSQKEGQGRLRLTIDTEYAYMGRGIKTSTPASYGLRSVTLLVFLELTALGVVIQP